MQIDQPQLEQRGAHQQVLRMQVAMHHAPATEEVQKFLERVQVEIPRLVEAGAGKAFREQDRLLQAGRRPAFAQRKMADDGDCERLEPVRQLPFLAGRGVFEKVFQRTQRPGVVAVALHEIRLAVALVGGDEFGGGFLDDAALGFQNRLEERLKIRLEFPTDAILFESVYAPSLETVVRRVNARRIINWPELRPSPSSVVSGHGS